MDQILAYPMRESAVVTQALPLELRLDVFLGSIERPSPSSSPFVIEPRLLPRLVRFLNHHPSLSYLYSHEFVGSSGQSARGDERGSDALDELSLTLALLARTPDADAALLWRALSPFLCDIGGNNHRAEINIEKLWNPYFPGRGQLGLVEFRARRMQQTPERVPPRSSACCAPSPRC